SPGRQVTISRITAEIDELADQIIDIGPRPIRVPERSHRVQPTPPARHPSLPTRIVTPAQRKSQQILSRSVLRLASADLFGQGDDDARGAAEVTEQEDALVLGHLAEEF